MKPLKITKRLSLVLLLAIGVVSCSKEALQNKEDLSVITVELKTITNDFQNVFLDIENVELRTKESNVMENAWISLKSINSGTHNADHMQSDNGLILVEHCEVKAMTIYEIRLNLGNNNFININNTLIHLDVQNMGKPSASNLMNTTLLKNNFYTFVININIDESLSFDENQNIMILNPKIYTEIRQVQY